MGSDCRTTPTPPNQVYFNPRSPDGERLFQISKNRSQAAYFNPRSPDGERLGYLCRVFCHFDFNPRSPDGERLASSSGMKPTLSISIHAPRMGSDLSGILGYVADLISIHAPRMGSDALDGAPVAVVLDFNPRSPDGERPRKWTSSPTIWAKSSIFNTDCIADRR